MKHLFILSILMLAAGCQSVGHHAEQTDESVMDTTIQDPQQLERIDPHAQLILKFHHKNKKQWTDMELWYDKIYYHDTVHVFEDLEFRKKCSKYVYYLWCNEKNTVIMLPVYLPDYLTYPLLLYFEGSKLCKLDTIFSKVDFFNDIDKDGCVELCTSMIDDDSNLGLFYEEDSITYYAYNIKHYVYKYLKDTMYLDADLSAKVHNLLVVQHGDTVIEAWGNDTVSLYEYRYYIDLNKSTLADYGVK